MSVFVSNLILRFGSCPATEPGSEFRVSQSAVVASDGLPSDATDSS